MLNPSWLKASLPVVASTFKDGNDRLRKGNKLCCQVWSTPYTWDREHTWPVRNESHVHGVHVQRFQDSNDERTDKPWINIHHVLGCVPLGWSGSGSVIRDPALIMVDQMNRWILIQSGFIGSFDLPLSERSRITDPDPDHPKGTHPWLAKSVAEEAKPERYVHFFAVHKPFKRNTGEYVACFFLSRC